MLLSARCTDERVNQVTPILFDKADSPKKMLKLKIDEIKQIIREKALARYEEIRNENKPDKKELKDV